MALAVKSAAFVNKGKHLMYLDSKGDLSIIAAGGMVDGPTMAAARALQGRGEGGGTA